VYANVWGEVVTDMTTHYNKNLATHWGITHQLIPDSTDTYRETPCEQWEDRESVTPHPTLVTCTTCKEWLRDPANKALALAFEAKVMAKA
jgi:hypothetical protein